MTQKELDQLQAEVLTQLKSGESLFGKDGAFAPMLKGFIEAALQAGMDAHLDPDQRQGRQQTQRQREQNSQKLGGQFSDRYPTGPPEELSMISPMPSAKITGRVFIRVQTGQS